eukprot:scaffold17.g562.t1
MASEEEPLKPPPARAWPDALPVLLVVAATVPLNEALALRPLCRELCAAVGSRVRGIEAATEDAVSQVCSLRAERWPQLQKLLLQCCPGGSAARELGAALRRLPRLRELTLQDWDDDRARALFAAARLPVLERLTLTLCFLGAQAFAAPGLPSLRRLELLDICSPRALAQPANDAADGLQDAAAGDPAAEPAAVGLQDVAAGDAGDAPAEPAAVGLQDVAAGDAAAGDAAAEPAAVGLQDVAAGEWAAGDAATEPADCGAALAPAFQHWPALEGFTAMGCHHLGCTPFLVAGLRWCQGLRSLGLGMAAPYCGTVLGIAPFAAAWPQLTSLNLHGTAMPGETALEFSHAART